MLDLNSFKAALKQQYPQSRRKRMPKRKGMDFREEPTDSEKRLGELLRQKRMKQMKGSKKSPGDSSFDKLKKKGKGFLEGVSEAFKRR